MVVIIRAIKSLNWAIVDNDKIDTGLNLFQMSRKAGELNRISYQEAYEMLHSRGANLSF